MLQGGHPLREKLTLFWHNHFATSIAKVRDAGPDVPPELPAARARPRQVRPVPAGDEPRPGHARLARLQQQRQGQAERELRPRADGAVQPGRRPLHREGHPRGRPRLHRLAHRRRGLRVQRPRCTTTGTKTVLGQTGNLGRRRRGAHRAGAAGRGALPGPQALPLPRQRDAAPPDALLEPLSESFRKSDYDIAALVRTILASRHFYSDHAFRQRIKSPVEYVLGAVQAVYRRYDEDDADYRPLPQQALVRRLDAMGQALFAPPNVKGWPGGRSWLNTSTVLARDNFAAALATGHSVGRPRYAPPARGDAAEDPAPPQAFDPARLLDEEKAEPSRGRSSASCSTCTCPAASAPRRGRSSWPSSPRASPTGAALDRRVREAVHAILTMPEYQLA